MTHALPPALTTVVLLVCSNVFMTFAWYAHLKELNDKPWVIAALVSWGVALLEYLFQVPANRIGYQVMSIGQLKILQEVITLSVFVPFALFYLKEPLKLDCCGGGTQAGFSPDGRLARRRLKLFHAAATIENPIRVLGIDPA